MDSERPFRTTSSNSSTSTATASSELFICFTSRLSSSSSSSMKISSKSILSPGRAREPSQISLSTSLSRRLKTSGSLKGGQASPMFPTGGKKRGCAFDNPEPSSPKVTCIGQVRVKTKKQGKKMRARSQKRRTNSEASFRKSEQVQAQTSGSDQQFVAKQSHHLHRSNSNGGNGFQIQNSQQQECLSHRNQKWVHLPFTICEALRAFGAELNCFLPCHSSCTNDRDKESKPAARSSESESSCGTVFARWLVAVQDGDGKGREIELVVGDDETRTEKENGSQRRHVFEGIDFKEKNEVVEEEESRISICIPPKNALLLMRCRSDPVKMAELAKRFCESPAPKVEEEDEEDEEEKDRPKEAKRDMPVSTEEEEEERKVELNVKLKNEEEMSEEAVSDGEEEEEEEEVNLVLQEEEDDGEETIEIATENEIDVLKVDITVNHQSQEEPAEEEDDDVDNNNEDNQQEKLAEETMAIPTSCDPEVALDAERPESAEEDESKLPHGNEPEHETEEDEEQSEEEEEGEDGENGESGEPTSPSLSGHTEQAADEGGTEVDGNWEEEENTGGSIQVKETTMMSWEDEEKATHEEIRPNIQNDEMGPDESKERETPPPEPERETQASVLPDCLLLMMYEPKLSMEVSKETWVCSTDFIRCVPTREKKTAVEKTNGRDGAKKRVNVETKPTENTQAAVQPARWSCSFPAQAAVGGGVTMATMIEQKLVSAKAYEPFVLTRCKSEPMRSSAKLAPDASCFWKDRKLEPHRPATVGVGAAGVGF